MENMDRKKEEEEEGNEGTKWSSSVFTKLY